MGASFSNLRKSKSSSEQVLKLENHMIHFLDRGKLIYAADKSPNPYRVLIFDSSIKSECFQAFQNIGKWEVIYVRCKGSRIVAIMNI